MRPTCPNSKGHYVHVGHSYFRVLRVPCPRVRCLSDQAVVLEGFLCYSVHIGQVLN